MPDWLAYVRAHLPPLPLRPEREAEIVAELAQQLDEAFAESLAAGARPDEAHARARAQISDWPALGAQIAHAEAPVAAPLDAVLRPRRAGGRLADGLQELRQALRLWRRRPGFALAAALTLALGIGAVTAIFGQVNAAILRPLPYLQPQRLVAILESSRQVPQISVSWPDYSDWHDRSSAFSQLAAVRGSDMILDHLGTPAMVVGQRVTANYFSLLGAAPALGRTFLPAEDRAGAPAVVVVSTAFFQNRLGSDPHWLDRTLDLDGRARTLIGVMPAGFPGLGPAASQPGFWTPLGAFAASDSTLNRRGSHAGILVLGRLRPGVSLEQARAELDGTAAALGREYPASNAGIGVTLQSYHEFLVGDTRPGLLLLLAGAGLLLLVACANVANLLLARAAGQARQRAIRAALGASRARLLRQSLFECLGLGLGGCGLGLLLAKLAGHAFSSTAGPQPLDGRVLAFAILASLATSALSGLAPALLPVAPAGSLAAALHGAGASPRGRRWREALVSVELALAVLLLVGTGLLVRSLVKLERLDPGFQPRGVFSMIVGLPATRYPQPRQQSEFFRQAMERMRALPGVIAAGGAFPLPLGAGNWQAPFRVVGQPAPPPGRDPATDIAEVRGDYFGAMGIRLLAGRRFGDRDTAAAPRVAIVDQAFAQRYAGLGAQVNLDGVARTIIGVVARVRLPGLPSGTGVQLYLPQAQSTRYTDALYFVLRARSGPANALRPAAIAQITAVDPDQPVTDAASMEQRMGAALAQRQALLDLLSAFAILALTLGAVGIYGVMSYAVAQRTREIGVRMALGATPGHIGRAVLGRSLRLAGLGALVGVLLALGLGRYLSAFLFDVGSSDPLTLVVVLLLVLGIAALASYLPARRASRLDPLAALRRE